MYLIQLLLPLADNQGTRLPREVFDGVNKELLEKFEGFTAYPRAPASGLWRTDADDVKADEIIVYEVMVETIEREWWQSYRATLEARFRQNELHIRALTAQTI